MKILPVASVVTKKSWDEFLLTKFSFEQYHDAEWYISCDKFVQENIQKLKIDNVVCIPLIDHDECDHNTTDENKKEQWMKVMMTKFDACEKALKTSKKVLFLDSDMLFVNPLGVRFISYFEYGDIDAMICPHMTGDFQNEGKHGYFNAGMFAIKSQSMIEDWKKLSSAWKQTGLYFEQKPLEFIKNKYFTINLPITYNFGWWRLYLNSQSKSREAKITVKNNKIYFHDEPIVNFHTHLLKRDVSDQYSFKMRDLILNKLEDGFNNLKYRKLLEYYEDLRSQQ